MKYNNETEQENELSKTPKYILEALILVFYNARNFIDEFTQNIQFEIFS